MVSSYLQLLETNYADELDEEARTYIDFAVDGSDRMREMIEGLLAYSRIDMDDIAFEPVESEDVVDDVLTDLQVRIDETDSTVIVDSLPAVYGDPQQIEQLLSNLISNAIKYSGEEPPRVEISAEKRGNRCVFSVADEGIGIEPEYVDQIFEIFNRLHSNEECQGTGIGLALCEKIVDHHGGDIWVDTEPGRGTTFYFTLPTAK